MRCVPGLGKCFLFLPRMMVFERIGGKKVSTYIWRGFCTGLEDDPVGLVLPSGLEGIPDVAFENCSGLGRVCVPGSVRRIGVQAFCGCEDLERVDLREGVEMICAECFSGCESLERVEIPASVRIIGKDTGTMSGGVFPEECRVYLRGEVPPEIGEGALDDVGGIYVKRECVEAYKEAWPGYKRLVRVWNAKGRTRKTKEA